MSSKRTKGVVKMKVYPEAKAICNSVIIEGDKIKSKKTKKRPVINTLQRKFTVKNKRESDSLLVYNDDYKDSIPNNKKKHSNGNKARTGCSRRSGKDSRYEGRFSSRKPMKVPNIYKQSHKRSQSLNKSTIEQRYRSQPQGGHQYEHEHSKKAYAKKKLNWFFNNRTPQVNVAKGKGNDNKLDLSLKNAKKNLQNYFKDNANLDEITKKKFASLTGREKGNPLLRNMYLKKRNHKNALIRFSFEHGNSEFLFFSLLIF